MRPATRMLGLPQRAIICGVLRVHPPPTSRLKTILTRSFCRKRPSELGSRAFAAWLWPLTPSVATKPIGETSPPGAREQGRESLPAETATVSFYFADRSQHLTAASLTRRIAAISKRNAQAGFLSPTRQPGSAKSWPASARATRTDRRRPRRLCDLGRGGRGQRAGHHAAHPAQVRTDGAALHA